jgi:hypothetical protein
MQEVEQSREKVTINVLPPDYVISSQTYEVITAQVSLMFVNNQHG